MLKKSFCILIVPASFLHASFCARLSLLLLSRYDSANEYITVIAATVSYMHIISILCSRADAVSSGSWPILSKILTLNVAICIVCLHFSCFCLSPVADFSNTEARAPTSAGRAPFLPVRVYTLFVFDRNSLYYITVQADDYYIQISFVLKRLHLDAENMNSYDYVQLFTNEPNLGLE